MNGMAEVHADEGVKELCECDVPRTTRQVMGICLTCNKPIHHKLLYTDRVAYSRSQYRRLMSFKRKEKKR